jgi:hypothetical protein
MLNNYQNWETYLEALDERIKNHELSLLKIKNNLNAVRRLQNEIEKHFERLSESKNNQSP